MIGFSRNNKKGQGRRPCYGMHVAFGMVALGITLIGYWILSTELKKATTKPPISSWVLWTIINVLLLSALLIGNAKIPQLIQMTGYTVGTVFIAILVYRRGTWTWTVLDSRVAGLAGLSLLLWAIMGNEVIAIALFLIALTVASVPTWQALLIDPKSQSEWPWFLFWIGGVLNIFAVEEWSYVNGIMPVWILLMQSATACIIVWPDLKKQGDNVRGAAIATIIFLFVMTTLIYMMIATMPHLKAAYDNAERRVEQKAGSHE